MFDALFRQIKDRLFVSVAKMLDIPPNLITVFSLILGGLTVGFVLKKLYLAALIFWILNRLFDGLDGAIARIHQRQTDLGGYIDILSDFIIYAAIPISLVVSAPTIERYFCLTLMISTFYVNAASWMYLSAILEKQKQGSKTSREDTAVIMPTGLVGGTETVLMYSLFFMMPERIAILFSIMSILVGLTICQRLIWATVKL